MRLGHFAFLSIIAGAAVPAAAQVTESEQRHDTGAEFSTGVEYQQGAFAGDEVEMLSVQNAVRVQSGRATFSASLPLHRIEAPGNVVGGGGLLGLPIIIDPTRPATRSRREGIGDLRIGAAYALPQVSGFDLSVYGQVKLPTAEASLGTGETDISIGGDVSRSIGMVTPFLSVAYTMPGDPRGYDLENSLSARGGVGLQLARRLRGNVSYAYASSVSASVPDEQQISTALSASINRVVSIGIHGNVGLSHGSPDLGAGLTLGFRLF